MTSSQPFSLTEDYFNYQYSGDQDHWNWELANHPRYTNPWTKEEAINIRDQILSDHEIVKRLREFYDKTKDENWSNSMEHHVWMMRNIKEILGEKELPDTIGTIYEDESRRPKGEEE